VLLGGESDPGDADANGSDPTRYTVRVSTGTDHCVIAAPDNRKLTGSLFHWGDAPLPLTGG
jgi:hypothetical protein